MENLEQLFQILISYFTLALSGLPSYWERLEVISQVFGQKWPRGILDESPSNLKGKDLFDHETSEAVELIRNIMRIESRSVKQLGEDLSMSADAYALSVRQWDDGLISREQSCFVATAIFRDPSDPAVIWLKAYPRTPATFIVM